MPSPQQQTVRLFYGSAAAGAQTTPAGRSTQSEGPSFPEAALSG